MPPSSSRCIPSAAKCLERWPWQLKTRWGSLGLRSTGGRGWCGLFAKMVGYCGFGQQNRWFKQQTWWFWSNLTTQIDVENMTGLKKLGTQHVSICFEFKARTPKYIEKLIWMPASDQTKTIYVILQTWIKYKSLKVSFGCFWRYKAGSSLSCLFPVGYLDVHPNW